MKRYLSTLVVAILSTSAFATQTDSASIRPSSEPMRHISPPAPPGHIPPAPTAETEQPVMRQTTRMPPVRQLFSTGSAALSVPSASLKNLAQRLLTISSPQTVIITGFTDNSASESAIHDLSERRARSVQQYLAKIAPQHRYIVTGKGASSPEADNNYPEGREKNRRVTISIQGGRI